jgi:multidrug resistance efflux pump
LCGVAGTLLVARSKQEPIRGVYRQEVVAVTAETGGVIQSLDRPHGAEVQPGDCLITLENRDLAAKLERAEAEETRLRRELDDAKAKAAIELATRLDGLGKERLETRLRYADLLRTRLDVQLRRKVLENGEHIDAPVASTEVGLTLTSIETPGKMRQLALADAANHEEVLDTQIALCEDRLAELDRRTTELPPAIDRLFRVDSLTTQLTEVAAEQERLNTSETASQVASPAYGRVGVYRRQPGEFVAAGETLVEIYDSERPYVLVSVSLEQMSDYKVGRHVRVAFDGTPTRKPLEGVISDVISEAERNADAASAPGAVTARLRITPVGRLWPTPPAGATALVQLLP